MGDGAILAEIDQVPISKPAFKAAVIDLNQYPLQHNVVVRSGQCHKAHLPWSQNFLPGD